MKKISIVIIIGILLLSSVGIFPSPQGEYVEKTLNQTVSFTQPNIKENNDYVSVDLVEATSLFIQNGKPMLPMYTTVITLPIGSKITSIDVDFSQSTEIHVHKHVKPSPKHYPENMDITDSYNLKKDETVYNQDKPYPTERFSYSISAGLKDNELALFLTINCFPLTYIPSDQVLVFSDAIDICVSYIIENNIRLDPDMYDMVIIAPDIFSDALQPLIDHKIDHGLSTILKTTEEIYNEYSGQDQQEQIKYFIKDAKEQWGVTYVLLVGGMIGQNDEWYLPVRYTNNHAGVPFESGFISDLYYADLYKLEDDELVFEDWDSNGNGIYAEFVTVYNDTTEQYDMISKDILDCRPDVHLGRLACRSVNEVDIVVEKIISYEQTAANPSWFDRLLLVAGDTYPLPDSDEPDAYEAEIDTDLTASYMNDFEPVRLWTSTGTLVRQNDVVKEINNGAGFIHMAGHANPSLLVTNTPRGENGGVTILNMYNIPFLNAYFEFRQPDGGLRGAIEKLLEPVNPKLRNQEKQPVIVIGGCHNSQFNVTLNNIQKHGFFYAYGYGIHAPKCFSWYLTSLKNGGAIATMGNTGLGMGYPGYNYTEGLDGWLFPRFFYHYGVNENHILGECFSAAITDYVNEFDINEELYGPAEDGAGAIRQMVEQWELFGDPSLKIGGYQ